MPDEPAVVATQEAPPNPAPRTRGRAAITAPPPEAPPQAQPLPDFQTALDALNQHLAKGTPEYEERLGILRSHGLIAGVAGSIAESMKKADNERAAADAAIEAARAKEQELLDLAENDPEEFAARFRTQAQADRARQELEDLRTTEQQRIASQIGLAARDLPELQDLDLAEQRKIADALAHASADQMLAVYNAVLIDITADRRATARMEAEFPNRLAAELEAKEAETNAQRVRNGTAPSLGVRAREPASDEPDYRLDPVGYLKWIDAGGRRRLATRG